MLFSAAVRKIPRGFLRPDRAHYRSMIALRPFLRHLGCRKHKSRRWNVGLLCPRREIEDCAYGVQELCPFSAMPSIRSGTDRNKQAYGSVGLLMGAPAYGAMNEKNHDNTGACLI